VTSKTLEEDLLDNIRASLGEKKEKTLEEALEEALENTTPESGGAPRKEITDPSGGSEWI
jgi:hypothetical protein